LILMFTCAGLAYSSWPRPNPIPDELRANLHCQNISIRTYQTPRLKGEPDGLGYISATIAIQNIGRSSIVGQAITRAALYISLCGFGPRINWIRCLRKVLAVT
jgi:hypothetical protein